MTSFVLVVIFLAGIALLAEGGARIVHRRRFLVPFQSKVIGEYPYNSFILQEEEPLHYRFRKGFRSRMVNINRFGCRGPEPAPDGTRRRLLVIGESYFFGARLRRETDLWSHRLENILRENGHGAWEVINAGNPTYNSVQHRALWERELREINPDIVVVGLGANDVSQAWMMGSQWEPGAPWPWKFILMLERRSPWWNKLAGHSCLYFLVRRGGATRKAFPRWDEDFQWEACVETVLDNYRSIIESARAAGARAAGTIYAFAYDMHPDEADGRRLAAIQSNWRSFVEGRGEYDYQLIDRLREFLKSELEAPYVDLTGAFHGHPRRYELYLDLVHFNPEGMGVCARTLYEAIDARGWWDEKV